MGFSSSFTIILVFVLLSIAVSGSILYVLVYLVSIAAQVLQVAIHPNQTTHTIKVMTPWLILFPPPLLLAFELTS